MLVPLELTPENEETFLSYVNDLIEESVNDPNREPALSAGEKGIRWYRGEWWDSAKPELMRRVAIDRLTPAVDAAVAQEMGDQPEWIFEGREQGEPPGVYVDAAKLPGGTEEILAAMQARAAMLAAFPAMLADYQAANPEAQPLQPPAPTSEVEMVADVLLQLKVTPENLAPFVGEDGTDYAPLPLKPEQAKAFRAALPDNLDALVEVDDGVCAHCQQILCDAKMDEGDALLTLLENVRLKKLQGDQDVRVGWNDEGQFPVIVNAERRHVYPDPMAGPHLSQCQYYILLDHLDAAKALAEYPEAEEEILRGRHDGLEGLEPRDFQALEQAELYDKMNFKRHIVRVVTGWIRHAPVSYLTEEEALERRLVTAEVVPLAQPQGADGALLAIGPEGVAIAPTRTVYRLAGKGEKAGKEVTPGEEGWPVRLGIREFVCINRKVVRWQECEWPDFPVAHNAERPLPRSYWGKGLAALIEGPQEMVNDTASDIMNLVDHAGFPTVYTSDEVEKHMGKSGGLKNMFNSVGRVLVAPINVFQSLGGKIAMVQEAPGLSSLAAILNVFKQALQLCDQQSSFSNVMRGDAPSGMSGKSIALLQQANYATNSLASLETENFLARVAWLVRHAIAYRMSVEDWGKYISEYPPWILAAIRKRCQNPGWNVRVKVSGGGKQADLAEKQNALMLFDRQLVTKTHVRKKLGINNEQEKAWEKEEAVDLGKGQMEVQSAVGGAPAGAQATPEGGVPPPPTPPGEPTVPGVPGGQQAM